MPVGTYENYVERLQKMKPNVYINGEKVDRTGDWINGGLYVMKQTFDCAHDPAYEELCTATSHLTGEKINRYTHIHQNMDDLLKKQRMTRLLCHRVGGCIQRCMGIDALNALAVVTYDMDEACGTEYNKRFLKYLEYTQANDLVGNCAQTDTKGHRMKRPHEQEDLDQYLRIVEVKPDGIIVRGAKICNSNAPYVDEIIVTPTRFMGAKDAAYAVSFAIPADWEGVKLMALPGGHSKRKNLLAPMGEVGDVESMTIFDDVFVPNERVFMNGLENPDVVQYAGYLALMFAHFHRHSYTGCKAAISEVLASQAALVAEYNGIEKAEHVKEKISHIIGTAELVFAAGQASAYRGVKFPSGSFVPDEILTNAGRRLAGQEIYNEYSILADLAGGLSATLPLEGEFYAEETAELVNKYIIRNPNISAEDTHRCFRMVENQLCSHFAGATMVAGMHGGGSPIMETIAMMGAYDLEALKNIAKYLAGINPDLPIYERATVTPRRMLDKFKKSQK
ncbi:4-hydroxyphenylacetate 3-hydroxylase family protein [Desulfosporosinus sp. BICA1-9]|uniref:4-hydroxyphenylacetate 3-hydroxylase family protein n=1 Tax=Desulfosporosinus sp. BICA1-9 TaxID=1531958 RepID=UPI00054C0EEA|nr:4-hydroxyphenylacetate 3-hydroxylase N-terminal domain-containing protein [Desulfosporosinus sp. BICA1-9]KJS47920.1 MAG: aromatic ring hydroxylase [Peptococcaceae bacterium BRH_c23]KJS82535.1 MAG: aromatic ring hydroxylase [Desulfosporosinus sp. BICA1-9]HBW35764.1 aromatic ring hydroxylase [Desulfosporosinus sp.]